MPIKLFTDGEILTASSVNTYFMDQALVVFETEAARDAAFGATGQPILQEGRICYVKADDKIYIYTGDGWTPQLAVIEAGVVTTENLDGTPGSEAVTTAKIRTGAVTSDKIFNETIVNLDIAPNAQIALTKLANGALPSGITISSSNIPDITVETSDIQNGAVTTDKLDGTSNSEAVTTAKIRNGAVTELKIGPGAVTSEKLGTSLSLTTPTLGVASATSINKVAFTAPATSATLTLANGSTLATSGAHSVTLTSTGATTITLPTTGTLVSSTGTSVVSESMINYTTVPKQTVSTSVPSGGKQHDIWIRVSA
jgi:hypothetical protein